MTSTAAIFDAYQTIAFGSITTSLVAVGTPFLHQTRMFTIHNNTDGDLSFSNDGTTLQVFVPAYTSRIWDIDTNRQGNSNQWVIPSNTQWYVKYISAPTKGAVYIESVYGKGE